MKRTLIAGIVLAAFGHSIAAAAPLYFNGFETDVLGWTTTRVDRVASGTSGVPSAAGSFHAVYNNAGSGSANTGWGATAAPAGGYNFGAGNNVGVPFRPYATSVDVYLDLEAGMANDTRFDFTSAINNTSGAHRRDFAFNGGFYNDATGPGAGVNRFVFSGSNSTGRANSFPKNPARNPVAVTTTGWYTLQHDFRDNGAGVLEVELSLLDSSSSVLGSWLLSDPSDLIDVTVGGNRYGWFASNELGVLAFDNANMSAVPEPAAIALFGAAMVGLTFVRRRRS
jgi:hypothetical protein